MVMAPEVKFDLGGHGGLRGHGGQIASKFRYDLRIELSDLDYPDIHVQIASNGHFGSLGGHGGLGGHI